MNTLIESDQPDAASPAPPTRARQYGLAILTPLLIAAAVCIVLRLTAARLPSIVTDADQLLSVAPSPKVSVHARAGQTVSVEFTVKNVSDRPVRILGANTSCGCTAVTNRFPMEIGPGDSNKILLQMRVERLDDNGKFVQTADLLVNRAGVVPTLVIEAVGS